MPTAPGSFHLPDSVIVRAGTTGVLMQTGESLRRLAAADLVLLGEIHDNALHHALRAQLMAALAYRRPAIVFEQFAEAEAPLSPPSDGIPSEQWLDQNGFDRSGWKWPLHQPVVEAAIKYGRSLWGSNLTREALRGVVREGESAVPAHLRAILQQAPLDSVARAAIDRELDAGHCGQMPPALAPGMRAAQVARDAAMARALVRASESGPAWLIAGHGHVRRDFAVPRILRTIAPGKSVLAVGFLERTKSGDEPTAAERARFDIVVVTARVSRPDLCAG
ncbi:MAG: ChaN family lipoprotein [Longimicrobiales bacterium]